MLDPTELPEGGDLADTVVPSVGPDAGPTDFHVGSLSAAMIIVVLLVFMVWLNGAMKIFWQTEMTEEVEFFDCDILEEQMERNRREMIPIEDING